MTRRLELAAIAALAFAFAFLVQPVGDNEKAHYALTRALADGKPYVDEYVSSPTLRTIDATRFEGHVYAAKAPGVAAFGLPVYALTSAASLDPDDDYESIVWLLHLWVSVLPAFVLLLLVRAVGDEFEPGLGIAAAVALGATTLVLPFSTLLFSHLLAAALVFAAYGLLRAPSAARAALAGVLAGLAVVAEYPAGLAGALLFAYAASRSGVRGAAAYALGAVCGGAPALAFNVWAFGSALHFPYEGWTGGEGTEPNPGLFGLTLPDPHTALALLFAPAGIASLAAAAVGIAVLHRRGLRADAALLGGLPIAYLLYNASFVEPFGGASPGPRYLITAMPFLAAALAPALPRVAGAALGLAVASGAFVVAATLTSPLAAWDAEVLHRLVTGGYVRSAVHFVGIDGGAADAPFVLALLFAAAVAFGAVRRHLRRVDACVFAVVLLAWAILGSQSRRLLEDEPSYATDAGFVAIAAAAALTTAWLYRRWFTEIP